MTFTVTGKIVRVFDKISGTSKAGKTWQKQEYLLETAEENPQQICYSVFGDQAVELMKAEVGEVVELSFSVVSREYQGKWYTNVEGRSINRISAEAPKKPAKKEPAKKPALPGTVFMPSDETSDLPF